MIFHRNFRVLLLLTLLKPPVVVNEVSLAHMHQDGCKNFHKAGFARCQPSGQVHQVATQDSLQTTGPKRVGLHHQPIPCRAYAYALDRKTFLSSCECVPRELTSLCSIEAAPSRASGRHRHSPRGLLIVLTRRSRAT